MVTNGAVTAASLAPLSTASGQRLALVPALAWDALARAVQAAHGWTPTLTDSYRPYTVQERIFRDRYRLGNHAGKAGYTTDVRYWNGQPWTRRAGTAAAAVPGTSNHGLGRAVDAGNAGRSFATFTDPHRQQLMALAPAYGWSDAEGRRVSEPWHLTHDGVTTGPKHPAPPTPTPTAPAPTITTSWEDMIMEPYIIIRETRDGTWARVLPGIGVRAIPAGRVTAEDKKLKQVYLDAGTFDAALRKAGF